MWRTVLCWGGLVGCVELGNQPRGLPAEPPDRAPARPAGGGQGGGRPLALRSEVEVEVEWPAATGAVRPSEEFIGGPGEVVWWVAGGGLWALGQALSEGVRPARGPMNPQ